MSANKFSDGPLYSPFKQQIRFQERKQEYQVLLEFQLKRQKQKNVILEQRLRNKQMFIRQIKLFNQDLTTTFQKCQDQLNMCRAELNHIKSFEIRDYLQLIANLKHQIKKLEQENHRLTNNQGTIIYPNNQNQRNKSERNSRMRLKGHVYSNGSQKQTPQAGSVKRSKSRASYIAGQKQNEQGQYNKNKLMNFISQFLKMASSYVQIKQHDKLTSKLKIAWKWVKSIVKEWHQNKNTLEEHWDFLDNLQQMLNIQKTRKGQQLKLEQILNKIKQIVEQQRQ